MQSKSSFLDGNVYRNVLARHWFITPAYTVVMVFRLMQYLSRGNWQYRPGSGLILMLRTALTQCTVICAGASVLTAMLLYRWLFNTRHTAFITALPIRREIVFRSQAAAGFTLLTAGNLLTILAVAAIGANEGIGLRGFMYWVAVMTLLTVSFFGFASFCSLLTGSILILPVMYTVLLYSAVALEASVRLTSQFLVFGLTGQSRLFTFLSPVYYLRVFGEGLVGTSWQTDGSGYGSEVFAAFYGWPLLLSYAAAGALFFAAAVALLRRRRMESAGSVVAVPWLRQAFCWGAALAGAFSLGFFTLRLVFGYSGYVSVGGNLPRAMLLLAVMLIGAFLGWFGARGMIRKSVRVFNSGWKGFAVFAALLAAFVLSLETDVFGLERAVPKPEDVGSVVIYNSYSSVYETRLTGPEGISAAIELQKSIISHKALYERMPVNGYNWTNALEIRYYDHAGNVLFDRAYAAAEGAMAWSSTGNSYASDGSAWGSENPDLAALEELMNCREAVAQRLTLREFTPSAYTASNGYAYVTEDGYNVFSMELDSAQVWELYQTCMLPDSADSTLGQVRLLPVEAGEDPDRKVNVGLFFAKRGTEWGDVIYDGIYLIVPEDARRTNAWLSEHGMPPSGEPLPAEEPPVTSTYELPALNGLAALLEKVYLEYDPTTAGTVVSARWTRSMLEWYASAGEDPAAAREASELFARRYVITESFLGSLQKLRSAGEQLVSGRSGLVRDYRFAELGAGEVDALFNAIREGLENAE